MKRSEGRPTVLQYVTRVAADDRSYRRALFSVGLVAIGIRLLNVFLFYRLIGARQILDGRFYDDQARYLLGLITPAIESGPFHFAGPGYPYIVAVIYHLFASSPLAVVLVQAFLGGVCAIALGIAAELLLNERILGLISALLWAFYCQSVYYDGLLLVPSLTALLTTIALFGIAKALRESDKSGHRFLWGVLAGGCGGAATLLRASNGLLLLGLLGGAALVFRFGTASAGPRQSRHDLVAIVVGLIMGSVVVLVPFLVQQRVRSGVWVPVSVNGGMNFWIGNNASADGKYRTSSFLLAREGTNRDYTVVKERDAYLAEARRITQDPALSEPEASAFWRRQGTSEIAAHPLRWTVLVARKFFWFLNSYEPNTNARMSFLARCSPVLAWLPFRWSVLVILSSWGFMLMWRHGDRRRASLLLFIALGPLLACLIFFVSGEYRHPSAPALTIASAFALSRLLGLGGAPSLPFRLRAMPAGVASVTVILGLFVVVVWPAGPSRDFEEFKMYAEDMVTPRRDGSRPALEDYEGAERLLALASDSGVEGVIKREVLLLVHSNRAIQFADEAQARELVEVTKDLWRLAPEPGAGLSPSDVSRIYRNLYRRVQLLSAQHFVEVNPELSDQLSLLGAHDYAEVAAYVNAGRIEDGRAFAQKAVAMAPSSVRLMAVMGQLEIAAGRSEIGLQWLERSANGWPKTALPLAVLSEYFFRGGDRQRARDFFEEARRREPDAPELARLARLLAPG